MSEEKSKIIDLPIPVAVKKIGYPVAIGFFFHTMFNVVDTFFAGFIGTSSLAALAASFPVFFIIIAFSSGLGTGMNTLLSGYVAREDQSSLDRKFAQGAFIGLLVSVFVFLIGFFLLPTILRLQGVGADFFTETENYLRVMFNFSFVFVAFSVFNGALLAHGDTKPFQVTLVAGFFANVILNYFFVKFLGLGVKGIALSTIIIEAFQAGYLLYYLLKKQYLSKFKLNHFRPNLNCSLDFIHHGGLATVNMMIIGFTIFYILTYVNFYGEAATAAYGIAIRIEQILLLPSIALGMATQTLVGQNIGLGRKKQAVNSLFTTYKYAVVMGAVSAITLFLTADYLVAIFTSKPEVIEIGAYYLRITGFIHFAYNLMGITNHFYYAIKRPLLSVSITTVRSIVLPLIVYRFATDAFGLHGLWWSIFSINNFICFSVVVLTIYLARKSIVNSS